MKTLNSQDDNCEVTAEELLEQKNRNEDEIFKLEMILKDSISQMNARFKSLEVDSIKLETKHELGKLELDCLDDFQMKMNLLFNHIWSFANCTTSDKNVDETRNAMLNIIEFFRDSIKEREDKLKPTVIVVNDWMEENSQENIEENSQVDQRRK